MKNKVDEGTRYFSPQGKLILFDIDNNHINVGNCSKFIIRNNKFLLKIENFALLNLLAIFEDIDNNSFKLKLRQKTWRFEFHGVNSADANSKFMIKGNLSFNTLKNFPLLSSQTFESLDLIGITSDVIWTECLGDNLNYVDFMKEVIKPNLYPIVKKDLTKVNSDLFLIVSQNTVYNRRDISKISKNDEKSTKIDFISSTAIVSEPIQQVIKFFERYEDENKEVKALNAATERLLDFLTEIEDNKLLNG